MKFYLILLILALSSCGKRNSNSGETDSKKDQTTKDITDILKQHPILNHWDGTQDYENSYFKISDVKTTETIKNE